LKTQKAQKDAKNAKNARKNDMATGDMDGAPVWPRFSPIDSRFMRSIFFCALCVPLRLLRILFG